VVEVEEGTVDGQRIELLTTTIGLASTAKEITALGRRIEVDGHVLTYTVNMAAVGQPLQHHLQARLERVG
jgi:purine nucleoside permease